MDVVWAGVEALSTAVTTLVVIAAAIYARNQLREVRSDRNADLLRSFQEKYHGGEVRHFRDRLLANEFGSSADFSVERMTDTERLTYWSMVDDMQFLGALVHRNVVDFDIVVDVFNLSPPMVWLHIKADVEKRRRRVPPGLMLREFEWMADRYNTYWVEHFGFEHPAYTPAGVDWDEGSFS